MNQIKINNLFLNNIKINLKSKTNDNYNSTYLNSGLGLLGILHFLGS